MHVRRSIILADRDILKQNKQKTWIKSSLSIDNKIQVLGTHIHDRNYRFTCVSISGSAGSIFRIEPRFGFPAVARLNGFGELDMLFLLFLLMTGE